MFLLHIILILADIGFDKISFLADATAERLYDGDWQSKAICLLLVVGRQLLYRSKTMIGIVVIRRNMVLEKMKLYASFALDGGYKITD
jgi:hypothetical protein